MHLAFRDVVDSLTDDYILIVDGIKLVHNFGEDIPDCILDMIINDIYLDESQLLVFELCE